jgi:N12 class adenine-specific DNA methylase
MPDVIIDKRPNVDPFMDDPESYRLRAIERYDDSNDTASKGRCSSRTSSPRPRAEDQRAR